MVASGLFSSCATPEIVWPSAAMLLGLQQLVIEVAGLVLELLAVAHVTNQRVDPQAVAHGLGACRHLDPDEPAVVLVQPQQVIADRAFRP